ncbi:MAG: SLC13/DASS family transporter, partial [Bacteroidales bacterium]|nr:SLC13/DASS family transporter [Bacteroidales bacterium]
MTNSVNGSPIITDDPTSKKAATLRIIKLAVAVAISAFLWLAPQTMFGIPNLSIVEQRVIAIFVFGALMWIMEAIPAWTTSVLLMVLLLFTVSDSGLWFAVKDVGERPLGPLVSYKSILGSFADPIIILFLGGFILAIATSKTGIDVTLAKAMLKPFGKRSDIVLLGFILVTAVFSMFVSNTATAAMMLTFLAPVLSTLPEGGKGKVALALAIPIGANIGGMGTPIGTPPNAIALKYLNDPAGLNMNIGFGEWVMFMLPLALIILFIAWLVLRKMFPFSKKTIELEISGQAQKGWKTTVVYITFAITVLMWMTDKLTGVNSNVVAMLPIAVFCCSGIITKKDLEQVNWSVLWMVAGGFALGDAMNKTGLMTHMIEAIPFNQWSP